MADNHTNSYYFYRIVNKDNPEDYADIDASKLYLLDYIESNYPDVKVKSSAGAMYFFNSLALSNKELLNMVCERYNEINKEFPVQKGNQFGLAYVLNNYHIDFLARDNKLSHYTFNYGTIHYHELTSLKDDKDTYYVPIVFSDDLRKNIGHICNICGIQISSKDMNDYVSGDSVKAAYVLTCFFKSIADSKFGELNSKHDLFYKNLLKYMSQLLIQDYNVQFSSLPDSDNDPLASSDNGDLTDISNYFNSELIIYKHSEDNFYQILLSTVCYHTRLYFAMRDKGKQYNPLNFRDVTDEMLSEFKKRFISSSITESREIDPFALTESQLNQKADGLSYTYGVESTLEDISVIGDTSDEEDPEYDPENEGIPSDPNNTNPDLDDLIKRYNAANAEYWTVGDITPNLGGLPQDLADRADFDDKNNGGHQRK